MQLSRVLRLVLLSFILACNSPEAKHSDASDASAKPCDSEQATNKMLALNKVQSRLIAEGAEAGMKFALSFTKESAPVAELIGEKKYKEACIKAEEIAKKYKIDLAAEQKNMITAQQLAKDGGKGDGTCSVADAAKMQMEVHSLLQAEVDAGRKNQEIFQEFNRDTVGYAQMLSENPSDACALFTRLKTKYGLK